MALTFDLTRTARSLLNIEVNTIVRDNMTAEAMPPVPHALLDITQTYADTLSEFGVDMPSYFDQAAGDAAKVAPTWVDPPAGSVGASLTVAPNTFHLLREAAAWALTSNDPAAARVPAAERVLFDRIVNNCDTIKEMFKRFDKSLLDLFNDKTRADLVAMTIRPNSYFIGPDDLIQLQKMWDIGMEEIVAQTIVHVTGDVITRVQEALCRPGSETLFSIHRQSIHVSIARWKDLLDAVKEIGGAAVSVLLGGGKR